MQIQVNLELHAARCSLSYPKMKLKQFSILMNSEFQVMREAIYRVTQGSPVNYIKIIYSTIIPYKTHLLNENLL